MTNIAQANPETPTADPRREQMLVLADLLEDVSEGEARMAKRMARTFGSKSDRAVAACRSLSCEAQTSARTIRSEFG